MTEANPELANRIAAGGIATNYHDQGQGPSVLFIHGSGPGVSAWANWRLTIPTLSKTYRVIAPDMVGFGFTDRPKGAKYSKDLWVRQAIGLLDALGIDKVHVVGNSFGGAIALAMAIRHPERVGRLALMGSVGVPFQITPGLDAVWGYQASLEGMRKLLDIFAYDRSLVNDELAELRYQASIRPGFQEAFAAMFPAPRQR
ncbi:MAG TPA: alpha/beta hydrolase, partial [Roseiarcus sp.]|nr:alpha/beta hydrolase [Roseiarcus sp.]